MMMNSPDPVVSSLASTDASLARVGGKGRSLARMTIAGLPVPSGFLVGTDAYCRFVVTNGLQGSIRDAFAEIQQLAPESTETASNRIQSLFEMSRVPGDIEDSIRDAYTKLGGQGLSVAVRSSATAEDLPLASFAGQQDTYLNVCGSDELLVAVRRCWASLWTARAIDYRMRHAIDQESVAMGVVVQEMVAANVSGILFTANPATGDRTELVVNASFGLGEAIVGGEVTPDTYVVDRTTLETMTSTVGEKEKMIVPADRQGTKVQSVESGRRNELSLSNDSIRELAVLSLSVEELFEGLPQDIEWAVVDGKFWLLQSRPITNLPAAPLVNVTWEPPIEGTKLIRRQVVENMPEPLSPLFDELYLQVGLEKAMDQFLVDFGMRINISDFLERPFFLTVNGYAYCRASYRFSWRLLGSLPSILYSYVRVLPKLLRNLEGQWRDEALPAYLNQIEQWKAVDVSTATDEQLLDGISELVDADAYYWFKVSMMVGVSKITDGLLHLYLQSWLVPGKLTSGMFLRGFPSKTIEGQVELESIARQIQDVPSLRELVRVTPTSQLLDALGQNSLGLSIMADIDDYLQRYGHQIYNLDFVAPTQIEDPEAVLISLKTLVGADNFDTHARQAGLITERDRLVDQTSTSLGPIRRWFFRKFLGWAQSAGPSREEALFYMGAAWTTLRGLALELGRRLAVIGTLNQPEDVFFLERAELVEACSIGSENPELRRIATQRQELRESRKRLHPPGMIPEGSRWNVGPLNMSAMETQKRNAVDADKLDGFPVSPGLVTGRASVVLSPDDFHEMQPGTILVCPTTTPAWTPLFAQSIGLVTDIGGILAHGSIVAREYGIPAVLGTGNGTLRIHNGQRIEVDGDAGTVTILDDVASSPVRQSVPD